MTVSSGRVNGVGGRMQVMKRGVPRSGFTLIELLVVVAIIALLLGILLPSLSRARAKSRAVVCVSNIKQLAHAFFLYAEDYGVIPGNVWHGEDLNLDWCGLRNDNYQDHPDWYSHPIETSVLWFYMGKMVNILECPTEQRESNSLFDYCVLSRMAGARTDLPWRMTYPKDPVHPRRSRYYFPAMLLLAEEHSTFYNNDGTHMPGYDDGFWSNVDQFTDRHEGKATVAYLDGSAGQFDAPKGVNTDVQEIQDLKARQLRILVGDEKLPMYSPYEVDNHMGWINKPRD